jgi:hypothetical protein
MSVIPMSVNPTSAITVESGKFVQHTFDWDAAAPQTVPVVPAQKSTEPAIRRGRCEHVGSVMAVVLGKYGLSIDDLLRAIEERQTAVGATR